ncbi:MAG: hypothetical protein Q9179_006399 [Wetmoreana sp. 5 TL-2023]
MEDPNIILVIKAANKRTGSFLEDGCNDSRFIPPVDSHIENTDDCSRETTPLDSAGKEPGRIILAFDKKPKHMRRGFTFGSAKSKCDVYIGTGSTSRVHFSITFDGYRRIILRDSSTNGTSVSYQNEEPQSWRRNFTWILFPEFQPIEVRVGDSERERKLTLEIPTHETCGAEYRANIASYLKDSADADPPLGLLGIASQETTVAPSAILSPRQRPQYHRTRLLGEGEFGVVRVAVDVSTGCVFAGKRFFKGNWKREVEAIRHLSHEHIIRLVDVLTEPQPEIIIEYFALGNLEDQHTQDPIAVEESAAILVQGTSALAYLHKKQLAHRDIKPGNILVETRRPFKMKFSDFGLAKNASELATCCGSHLYAAPEIFQGKPYTAAVDVWSLGVVVYQYVYGLPEAKGQFSPDRWFKKLMKSIVEWDADRMIDFLSTRMLKMDHRERSSADDCHQCSLELFRDEVYRRDPQSLPEDSRREIDTPANILKTNGNLLLSREAVQNQQNIAEPRSRNSSGERCASKRRCSAIGNPPVTGRVSRRALSPSPTELVDVDGIARNALNHRARLPTGESAGRQERDRMSYRLIEKSVDKADNSQRKARCEGSLDNDSPIEWATKGYGFVAFNGRNICYRLRDGWVNATHILYAAKMKRRAMQRYFKRMNAPREIVRGNNELQGTYTSLMYALLICDKEVPELKLVLQQALQKHGHRTLSTCVYDAKIIARHRRVQTERNDLPQHITPALMPGTVTGGFSRAAEETHKGLNAKRRRVSDERPGKTSDSLDESSEGSGCKLEEDTEQISSYDEESTQAATKTIRKSYHDGRSFNTAGSSHLSHDVERERKHLGLPSKKIECSNFTEPSFKYGSFLPPMGDSVLQREDPKL